MPEYTIQDAETGRELVVEGAVPPTPEDMEELFAESYRREGITPTPSDLVAPPPILPPVEEVVPEAVSAQANTLTPDDETEYLNVKYTELIPLMIASIQELSAKNDALEARIATLEG